MSSFTYKCYLCGGKRFIQREGHARDNENLFPLECENCGLVQLSSFAHINENFYEDSHMHDNMTIDYALISQRNKEDTERRFHQFKEVIAHKDILDFGCGIGDYLIKSKDIALSVCGVEPEKQYIPYYQENGIEVYPSLEKIPSAKKFDVITLFHVLEHLKDPVAMLMRIKHFLKQRAQSLCIIEVPSSTDALLTLYKNKAFSIFTYWSCHLFLFNEDTLKTCAEKAGLKTVKIEQFQRYPVTNHLYWLAQGKPGGQNIYIYNAELAQAYTAWLAEQKMCDTVIGYFSL